MSDIMHRIENVIAVAANGEVTAQNLREAGGSLSDAGLDSMQILAVIMGLESEFGIVIDVNQDASFLMNTSTLAAFVAEQLRLECTT
jgi:acyl carrier protein